MKKYQFIIIIILILISEINYSQQSQQTKVDELTQVLNTNVASKFQVQFSNNKAVCILDEFNATLDLRNYSEIRQDSLTKEAKADLYKSVPYTGYIFWKYNFQMATSSEVLFKSNKYEQIFCKISFKKGDTISLKSSLNAFTSHHKTSDSYAHLVEWIGDKYISLLLAPKWVNNNVEMEVKGITISGKFQRKDTKEISKNYTKSLRKILRREFENLFKLKEMTTLISQKKIK